MKCSQDKEQDLRIEENREGPVLIVLVKEGSLREQNLNSSDVLIRFLGKKCSGKREEYTERQLPMYSSATIPLTHP